MSLVNDQCRVTGKIGLRQKLAQKHTVRHVLEHGLVASAVFETDRIANLITDFCAHLFSDTGSDRHGSDATRLCASNLRTICSVTSLVQILGQLGCLP